MENDSEATSFFSVYEPNHIHIYSFSHLIISDKISTCEFIHGEKAEKSCEREKTICFK